MHLYERPLSQYLGPLWPTRRPRYRCEFTPLTHEPARASRQARQPTVRIRTESEFSSNVPTASAGPQQFSADSALTSGSCVGVLASHADPKELPGP